MTPAGSPEKEMLTSEVNPSCPVMEMLTGTLAVPCATLIASEDNSTEKSGVGERTEPHRFLQLLHTPR